MKRFLIYIFLSLFVGLMATSCIEEMDMPKSATTDETEAILVPRVTSFANQYVTKSPYVDNEGDINSLAVLVFNSEGNLVFLEEKANLGDVKSITLNKSRLNLASATVVMFANMSIDNIKNASNQSIRDNKSTLTLSAMEGYSYHIPENQTVITDISSTNFAGFPMIGGMKGVDLLPTTTQEDPIEVSLKILYAKIYFEISVAQGTENHETGQDTGISFDLTGYSVKNTSKQTSLAIPTTKGKPACDFLGNVIDENEKADADGATASNNYETTAISGKASGTTGINGQPLKFTFYVSESRYNHNSDLTGIYPDDSWLTSDPEKDVKGYAEEADDANLNGVKYFYDDLIQQYKPKLAEEVEGGSPGNGLATSVLLTGTYTDYRGTSWNVNYTIYLGKDNAQNFHVDRNSEYTNYITIKGIRNNDSYSSGDVWVDHRVDVSYTGNGADDCITITRETLIDSHIEVRPLRVKWGKDNQGQDLYTFARIHLPYYTEDNGKSWSQRDEATSTNKNWIGIERGDKTSGLYCKDEVSKGKRKYFTTTLIHDLNAINGDTDIETDNGTKFILLNNNDCAWIYIDEYIYNEGTDMLSTNDRAAKIVVDLCKVSGNKVEVKQVEEYILSQKPLGIININDREYYLENYEEYLHSYNSYDKYNIDTSPTDYTGQGIVWGYSGLKVSKSQYVTNRNAVTGSLGGFWEGITSPDNGNPYDFFHANDLETSPGFTAQYSNENAVNLDDNTGFNFMCTASEQNSITISSMGERPTNAYQYCLSKNKFTEALEGDGHKMIVHWYIPDAYELSDIFASQKSPLSKNSYYWSSQPNYGISGEKTYIYEDVSNARAVSSNRVIEPKLRSERHRIRCLYDIEGVEANMSDRTPEGIGGLITIPMTFKDKGFFDYIGWTDELKKDEPTKVYDKSYKFPMNDEFADGSDDRKAADEDFSGGVINGVHYYAKNPLTEWGGMGEYYAYVHDEKWPGLTNFEVENVTDNSTLNNIANALGISSLCKLTGTLKSDTRIVTSRKGQKIDNLPTNDQLKGVHLDHNEDTKNTMKISFGQAKNKNNAPTYKYHQEDPTAAVVKTYTRYWNAPEYTKHNNVSGSDKKNQKVSISEYSKYEVGDLYTINNVTYIIKNKKTIIVAYYFDLGPVTGYKYKSGTGGWSDETGPTETTGAEAALESIDALTFYAGNTFTITTNTTTDQNGNKYKHYIRSVKVNYNTSTLSEGETYLRFVAGESYLPSDNVEPEQMTYLDGDNGWSKWTSNGNDETVTLRLVIYDKSDAGIFNWWNPPFSHTDPNTDTKRNYKLIINSLEIRLEDVPIQTD